jgi:hypothetical protein
MAGPENQVLSEREKLTFIAQGSMLIIAVHRLTALFTSLRKLSKYAREKPPFS